MAPTSAEVSRENGMHRPGRRREDREARHSSFSNSDPLLAQLMIRFG